MMKRNKRRKTFGVAFLKIKNFLAAPFVKNAWLTIKVTSVCVIAILAELALFAEVKSGAACVWRAQLSCGAAIVIAALGGACVYLGLRARDFAFRICFFTLVFCACAFSLVLFLLKTGLYESVKNVSALREYISGYGQYALPAFLFMQILQVAVLPIPGVVAIGVGVALFGAFKGALYSFIGITAGSFIAFFIGRAFGYKAAAWLVGEKQLKSALKSVEGKDKAVLSAMFLLPFFPDDVLCFVAGLSSMSVPFFAVMITFTRLISCFCSAYSLDGKIIPYDTWWGLVIWGALIILAFLAVKAVYKHGDKIEGRIKALCKKKNG